MSCSGKGIDPFVSFEAMFSARRSGLSFALLLLIFHAPTGTVGVPPSSTQSQPYCVLLRVAGSYRRPLLSALSLSPLIAFRAAAGSTPSSRAALRPRI
jgi:hypothetical protein